MSRPNRLFTWLRSLALSACALAAALPLASFAAPQVEDTIAQRTLACTACHGPQGRAAPDGYYPRLAGKPAAYLYNQLLNFREGRRHYGLMTQMVEPLSPAYLMEIAQYFASLDVPYPTAQASTEGAGVMGQGQKLVQQGDGARQVPACVQCHGQAMTGVLPNVPGLLGLPRDYLNAQLGAWKTGKRRAHAPDCMAQVVQRLSLEDIHAASTWLAAQPVPSGGKPVAAAQPSTGTVPAPACGSAPLPQPTGPAR
ncbi:MAG: c-type cytochrome [Pseudomonadota bacterium]